MNTNVDSLVSCVERLESMVRGCYSENIEFNKGELVKIILVDGGFILELFISAFLRDWNEDSLLSLNSWLHVDVVHDLLLLENQLPFFVLDELLKLAPPASVPTSLLELTFDFFSYYNLRNVASQSVTNTPHHFTDLLRTFYLQPEFDRGRERPQIKEELLYSVIGLHETGVKLKANTQQGRCLLDLTFSDGVLEIPQLRVEDTTEMLFRNMAALEQCIYRENPYITDYVIILDFLIKRERDVDVLVRKGIVDNWLGGNDEVAKLANDIAKNIYQADLNKKYHSLCKDLNAYCGDTWHIGKATLRRDYCKTPWQTAASVTAIVILVLTVIQTVCSLYQVNHGV